jgi:hypothetical protein
MLVIYENLLYVVLFFFSFRFLLFSVEAVEIKKNRKGKILIKKRSGIGKVQHIIDHGWLIIGISLEDRWLYFCIFFQS